MKYTYLLIFVSFLTNGWSQDRITGKNFATRSEVIGQNGMVCSSHPLASQVGLDILKRGGNAIDAAIATNATLGLMEPTGNGIGGDLFAIIWDAKTKKLYGLNASGRSPQSISIEKIKAQGLDKIPSHGPLPVSVPGTVDGWFELHNRFGQMPIREILKPAIDYANTGFPVTELISYYFNRSLPFYIRKGFPNIEESYFVDGHPPQKGDVFSNPDLAKTLQTIASEGRDAFYKGDIAHKIADFIQSQGGYLTYDDLATHKSEWIDPVAVEYRGYEVWELPPNGQGIAALQMLSILKNYDFKNIEYGSPEHLHYVTEAKKLAFEDRAKYYADMDFFKTPVDQLLSDAYGKERASMIDPNRAGQYKAGEISAGETIYLTTADSEGNMVSLIQSNYRGMGSGMVPPGLGFMLQDRGELFNLDPSHANALEGGKRPFHTIIPAFITKDGLPIVSFGVMGGDFQPQGHVQIVMNLIDFGMNLQEAGDAPRFEHTGGSMPTGEEVTERGEVRVESGVPFETIRELINRGHKVSYGGYFGGYQAIMRDHEKGVYYGASESRKDGHSVGY